MSDCGGTTIEKMTLDDIELSMQSLSDRITDLSDEALEHYYALCDEYEKRMKG